MDRHESLIEILYGLSSLWIAVDRFRSCSLPWTVFQILKCRVRSTSQNGRQTIEDALWRHIQLYPNGALVVPNTIRPMVHSRAALDMTAFLGGSWEFSLSKSSEAASSKVNHRVSCKASRRLKRRISILNGFQMLNGLWKFGNLLNHPLTNPGQLTVVSIEFRLFLNHYPSHSRG